MSISEQEWLAQHPKVAKAQRRIWKEFKRLKMDAVMCSLMVGSDSGKLLGTVVTGTKIPMTDEMKPWLEERLKRLSADLREVHETATKEIYDHYSENYADDD